MPDLRSPRVPKFEFPNLNFARANLGTRVRLFDLTVSQQGYKAIITPSIVCPCLVHPKDGGKGVPELECPACAGKGRIYRASDQKTTRVMVSSMAQDQKNVNPQGAFSVGTMSASFPSDTTVTYWDRVLFPDAELKILETHKFDAEKPIQLFFETAEIIAVLTRDPASRQVRELSAEQGDYVLDIDTHTLVINPKSRCVYMGMPLGVTYKGTPYYYVSGMSNEFRGVWVRINHPNQAKTKTTEGETETELLAENEQFARLPTYARLTRADMIDPTSGVV